MESLKAMAGEIGISLSSDMINQFDKYSHFLLEYNEKINLTAITDPAEIERKHFLDSLYLLKEMDFPSNASLIDVGTGAGFPGLPLKIVRNDIHLTLLDSLNKRLIFLEQLSQMLGQDNQLVHGRAEQMSHEIAYRESFDIATARAVASLSALCEYCLPYVKVGGVFAAYKGPDIENEAGYAKRAISLLGGELSIIKEYELPGGDKRTLVLIKKIGKTPKEYPRRGTKIAKQPLV